MDVKFTEKEQGEMALAILILAAKEALPRKEEIEQGIVTLKEISDEMFEDDEEIEFMVVATGKTKEELKDFSLLVHQRAYDEMIEADSVEST